VKIGDIVGGELFVATKSFFFFGLGEINSEKEKKKK